MCGIAGFEINGMDTPSASAALLDAVAPRGPDGSWAAVRGSFALVETRLADGTRCTTTPPEERPVMVELDERPPNLAGREETGVASTRTCAKRAEPLAKSSR
jgi:hypothetical protein